MTAPTDKTGAPPGAAERIAKRIARAGVCSRRDAEKLITAGRVTVNGIVIDSPALNVGPADRIAVDGAPLPAAEPVRLWRYHKPKGRITAARDPEGRPTIFSDLPPDMPRTVTIGRLDYNTEGLLLLTNDGGLARTLELPATAWTRRYRVRVHGQVEAEALAALSNGITLDGVRYGPVQAFLERTVGTNAWLLVALTEGKNREIRRLMDHLGLTVTRLIRIAYGPFQLGHLAPGAVEEVPAKQLADQLGNRLPDTGGGPAGTGYARARPRRAQKPRNAPAPAGKGAPPGKATPTGKGGPKPPARPFPATGGKPARAAPAPRTTGTQEKGPHGKPHPAQPRPGGGPGKPRAAKPGQGRHADRRRTP